MNATIDNSNAAASRIEELGRIIMAYSEVTERLQESHQRLEKTVTMLRDELSEKNRLLERKNRLAALGEMAAGMAHEIRNPLGGIQLYASLLAKDVADRADSLMLVQKISGGVKRLEGLVSQVLQFTREINVSIVEADLAEVVAQAVELATMQAEQHGVRCDVKGPPCLNAQIDPLLMGQAVLNLVLNAIEAVGESAAGERVVQVSYRSPRDEAAMQFVLEVRDSGPGIPAHVLERVFNPFFTTKASGTGLGLAIVHRVVEAHEGTITASNVHDSGARFEIRV